MSSVLKRCGARASWLRRDAMSGRSPSLLIASVVCLAAADVRAQPVPTGHVAVLADFLPNRDRTAEMRARLFAEEQLEPRPWVRLTASGFVEGLIGRRALTSPVPGAPVEHDVVGDAVIRVHDANVEVLGARADLLAGFARVPWGKLDELQPTDVINPLPFSMSAVMIGVVAAARLLMVDPVLALVGIALFPALAMINRVYTVRVEGPAGRVQARFGDLASVAVEEAAGGRGQDEVGQLR